MPIGDNQLREVLTANPPGGSSQGFDTNKYLTTLVDALAKKTSVPAAVYGQSLELKARFKVLMKAVHAEFFKPAPAAGASAAAGNSSVSAGAGASSAASVPDLLTKYSIKEQAAKRIEIAQVMGIKDKGHKTHKGSFSAAQSLPELIKNLFQPVAEAQRDEVAQRLLDAYGYDPR
ncbi:MAG TPA: hypothetical protein VFJ82_21370 [Longimicrobium sp.]|nr:hypothetical protein [Longimicrobium sp.]